MISTYTHSCAPSESTAVVVKRFQHSPQKVFAAIRDGYLMLHTGAWPGEFHWNFVQSGSWKGTWHQGATAYQASGLIQKIEEDRLVEFTWVEPSGSESKVSVSLEPEGNFTKVVVVQSNLRGYQIVADVMGGWIDALDGVIDLLASVSLWKSKTLQHSRQKVFEAISAGVLFGCCGVDKSKPSANEFVVGGSYSYLCSGDDYIKGKYFTIRSDEFVKCTWESTPCGAGGVNTGETFLYIYLTATETGSTRLDLFHDGFRSPGHQQDHDEGWQDVLVNFEKLFQ